MGKQGSLLDLVRSHYPTDPGNHPSSNPVNADRQVSCDKNTGFEEEAELPMDTKNPGNEGKPEENKNLRKKRIDPARGGIPGRKREQNEQHRKEVQHISYQPLDGQAGDLHQPPTG